MKFPIKFLSAVFVFLFLDGSCFAQFGSKSKSYTGIYTGFGFHFPMNSGSLPDMHDWGQGVHCGLNYERKSKRAVFGMNMGYSKFNIGGPYTLTYYKVYPYYGIAGINRLHFSLCIGPYLSFLQSSHMSNDIHAEDWDYGLIPKLSIVYNRKRMLYSLGCMREIGLYRVFGENKTALLNAWIIEFKVCRHFGKVDTSWE